MNKMNEVLKQKWIAALRSGEFKQSRYKLFNLHDKGYCCLGVLAVQQGATLDNGGCLRSSNWHDMKRAGSEYLRDEYAGGLAGTFKVPIACIQAAMEYSAQVDYPLQSNQKFIFVCKKNGGEAHAG